MSEEYNPNKYLPKLSPVIVILIIIVLAVVVMVFTSVYTIEPGWWFYASATILKRLATDYI